MLRAITVFLGLVLTAILTYVGLSAPAAQRIYWLGVWLIAWVIVIGILTTKKKPTVTEAEVKYAQEQEALCKALYELAWERLQDGKEHPRPTPLPMKGVLDRQYGYSDPIGDGFYKRKLRELLK